MRATRTERLLLLTLGFALGWLCPDVPPATPAPAPLVRREPAVRPLDLTGTWQLTWGGSLYSATLHHPNVWLAESSNGGCVWSGTWEIQPDGCTIHVEERTEGGTSLSWTVTLDRATLSGRTKGGLLVRFGRQGR